MKRFFFSSDGELFLDLKRVVVAFWCRPTEDEVAKNPNAVLGQPYLRVWVRDVDNHPSDEASDFKFYDEDDGRELMEALAGYARGH